MDKRGTLSANESFTELLKRCYEGKEKVSMILDDGGLQRKEGTLKSIYLDAQPSYFELEDGSKVYLHSVVAINGTFLSDYSEC